MWARYGVGLGVKPQTPGPRGTIMIFRRALPVLSRAIAKPAAGAKRALSSSAASATSAERGLPGTAVAGDATAVTSVDDSCEVAEDDGDDDYGRFQLIKVAAAPGDGQQLVRKA